MLRLLLTLALLLAPAVALAQSLAGFYDVWGRDLDGGVCTGTAEVQDDGELHGTWDDGHGLDRLNPR